MTADRTKPPVIPSHKSFVCDVSPALEERSGMVADLIIPHKLKEALKSGNTDSIAKAEKSCWDLASWQGLCKPHHDLTKQRVEKSGVT